MGDVNLEIKLKNIQEKTDTIDVDNADDGQVLTYNSANDKFEPKTPTGGGGIITSVTDNFNVDNGELDLSDEFKTVVNNKADLDDLADIFGAKSTPYVKGDMCIHDNVLYVNEYGTTSNTVFVPEHWTATNISHVISELNNKLEYETTKEYPYNYSYNESLRINVFRKGNDVTIMLNTLNMSVPIDSNVILCTLDEKFRPAINVRTMAVDTNNKNMPISVGINTNGTITVYLYANKTPLSGSPMLNTSLTYVTNH